MTTSELPKIEAPFTEAAAFWNTRYLDPSGFECQLTLCCDTGQELLDRAQGAIAFLLKNGCVPSSRNSYRAPDGNGSSELGTHTPSQGNGGSSASWCPIHQVEMRRWEKSGRVWYSHQVNGEWCTGKAKHK